MAIFSEKVFLVVEDSDDDVALLKRAFFKVGADNPIVNVADGREAIEYLEHALNPGERRPLPLPVAILSDLKMPRCDGFELLKWVRAQPALHHVLMVVLTSSALEQDVERAFELGVNFFQTKPADFQEQVMFVTNLVAWLRLNRYPESQASQPGVARSRAGSRVQP